MSAELTLEALLEHPDAGGLTVVEWGGRATWVSVAVEVREEDLPDVIEQGLAVLINPAPSASWQVDALLRRVRDRGFTGIALTGEPISAGSRALGAKLGLVELHVDHPTRLAQACWELLQGRDALTLSLVRRVAQSIEYEARDLPDLLSHINTGIGQGVALIDSDGVLQCAGDPLPESLRQQISFEGWLDIADTEDGCAASVPIDSRTKHGLRIALHSKRAGTAHRNAMATAVQVLMPMVAARLLIDEVQSVSDVSQASGLLGDFLEGRGGIDPQIEQRMTSRGWRTSGYHLGFRIVGRGRLDALELLRFVSKQLGPIPVDTHATTRGAGVSGWLTFAEAPSPASVAQRVRDVHEVHAAAQALFPIATGLGSLGSGSMGLVKTLGEARDAARLAADRSRAGWFVHIDSLGLEQLLLAWIRGDTFVPAARSLLSPLSVLERETLAAFLDEESSVVATAQRLNLHRNTVSARMNRVQGLLGVDLHDPEARLAIQLACRVAR